MFAVKFLPDEPNVLLSGGWDTNVHIWDVRVAKSIGNILGPKISGKLFFLQSLHIVEIPSPLSQFPRRLTRLQGRCDPDWFKQNARSDVVVGLQDSYSSIDDKVG